MDMQPEWIVGLTSWAEGNGNVRELWLFGSRAKGSSRPESDVDVAVALMPPDGKTNWALGNYMALGDQWQRDLGAIVGRHVSLQALDVSSKLDAIVRSTGVRLWSRGKTTPDGPER